MIKWTTPSIKCTIPDGLEFDFIFMTVKQGDYVIEKMVAPEQVEDNAFIVFFTQEETSGFQLFTPIEVQLNAMKDDVRIATNINQLCIERNLHDEYINPDFPTTLNIVENGRYCVVGYLYVDVDVEGGDIPIYDGSYNVIPSKEQQILETKDKKMIDDVTIEEISYTETSNQYGTTVAIATI